MDSQLSSQRWKRQAQHLKTAHFHEAETKGEMVAETVVDTDTAEGRKNAMDVSTEVLSDTKVETAALMYKCF